MFSKWKCTVLVFDLVALGLGSLLLSSWVASTLPLEQVQAEPGDELRAVSEPGLEPAEFARLLAKHHGRTFEQLEAALEPRPYLDHLSFDPREALHFDRVRDELQLNDEELDRYEDLGFVVVDHDQRYSFARLYQAIYNRDLPLLVTTDSVLHALHRSFSQMLQDLESQYFLPLMRATLLDVHRALARAAPDLESLPASLRAPAADVDLYLCVARRLFSPEPGRQRREESRATSLYGQSEALASVLSSIEAQRMGGLELFGRPVGIDFSQFRPRGHYARSEDLQAYFRGMMWLGRPDTGFPVKLEQMALASAEFPHRGAKAAALLVHLLREAGGQRSLASMSQIIDLLVGKADNLTVGEMSMLMQEAGVLGLDELASEARVATLVLSIHRSRAGHQAIRSQILERNPRVPGPPVVPPPVFQFFGQRFVIDSFVLSKVVFDAIDSGGEKVLRMMPSPLDVAAALGNDLAVELLEPELREYPYSPNLAACREYVAGVPQSVWEESLYNSWMEALRILDDPLPEGACVPEPMRTKAWQFKQLQTQLASWTELRHDTILFAKQSYTTRPVCGFPDAMVEPYPRMFAVLARLAEELALRLEAADFSALENPSRRGGAVPGQIRFLREDFAPTMNRLAGLAQQTLDGEVTAAEDLEWLKKAVFMRPGGCADEYDGWYTRLFLGRDGENWDGLVVDVHTDPTVTRANPQGRVLEVAVGDANFLVLAAGDGDGVRAYVGPTFSYYEFHRPTDERMTDQEWAQMISNGGAPSRPPWADEFVGPREKRDIGRAR